MLRQRGLLVDRDHHALRQRGAVHRPGRARPRRRHRRRGLHRREQRHRGRRPDQEQAGRRARARRRPRQDPERNHRAADAAARHRRLRLVLAARTGCRSTPAPPATTPPRASCRRSRAPAARSTIGTIDIDLGGTRSCSMPTADQSGILDTQSTTTNGGVTYTVAGATDRFDISALTDSAADLARPRRDHQHASTAPSRR